VAAGEIARHHGEQHHRDQGRPGGDAAAEIGVEVAAAQHLEPHQGEADDEQGCQQPEARRALRSHFVGGSVNSSSLRFFFSMASRDSTGEKSSVSTLPLLDVTSERSEMTLPTGYLSLCLACTSAARADSSAAVRLGPS